MKVFINGMNCEHCKMRIEKALKSIPEVKNVVVNLDKGVANIDVKNSISNEIIKSKIEEAGYEFGGIK
ncbi:MAG: heavy-metal-associated domain-containing protein [Kosmotoga sp.]|nr:MAG: heavy-metal-associated domain-containing protein [Kosmotoga sp.]